MASVKVGAEPANSTLRLLRSTPLPPAYSVATDIRWAGDHSVFISWENDGVAEVSFDGAKGRSLLPNLKALGGGINHYSYLALSSSVLGAASENWGIVWRPLETRADGRVLINRQRIPLLQDVDLSGDRIVILGLAQHEQTFAPKGEVAWVGTLHDQVADLKPVLHDAGGPGAPNFYNCGTYQVGSVRFLADGRFIIVPGFQDGAHLYDAKGRRVRSWTNEQIGIDSHVGCSTMSAKDEKKFRLDDNFLLQWVEHHHLLDDILPLPQGPGLLIRSWGADNQAHWTLKVLEPEGIKSYAVPVVGRRPYDRLHGDVRNGKIVLLLSNSGYPYSKVVEDLSGEILLMELPANPTIPVAIRTTSSYSPSSPPTKASNSIR